MKQGMILGYVEDKTIGENLDQVLKSDQIARYKQLSGNILLTDYLQFIWLKDGKINAREPIAFPHDLEGKARKPRDDRVAAVSTLLRGFFSTAPEGIGRSSNWLWRLRREPTSFATSSIRSSAGRRKNIASSSSMGFTKFSATRSSTN